MRLIKLGGPRCLVWSAAMLFDVEPEEILDYLKHDCVLGVHIQEIQSFALSKGFLLAPFEPQPMLVEVHVCPPNWPTQPWLQFEGIMLGETGKGHLHAVAWDGTEIYDPAIEPDFKGYHQFWAKTMINNHP